MKIKKLMLLGVLTAGIMGTAFGANAAVNKAINIYIDGQQVEFEVEPYIENGRTMVPLRSLLEAAGLNVTWDANTNSVNVQSHNTWQDGNEAGESNESGDPSSPLLTLNEGFKGTVNGVEVDMAYNASTKTFEGVVKNNDKTTAPSVVMEINLKQGTRTVVELGPLALGDILPGQQAKVALRVADEPEAKGVSYDGWEIHPEVGGSSEGSGEGAGEGHGAEGAESGSEGSEAGEGSELTPTNSLGINETYNQVNKGARLIIAYDNKTNTFNGSIENLTNKVLTRARVEVHTSAGDELGPTTPRSVNPGQKITFSLKGTNNTFTTWSTHAEFGASEGNEGTSEGSESGNESGSEGGRESSAEGREGSEGGNEGPEGRD